MNKAVKVLIIILFVILLLCAAGAAGVLLWRNSGRIQIMDWHGKKKKIPPIRTGLPEIPMTLCFTVSTGDRARQTNTSASSSTCRATRTAVTSPENMSSLKTTDIPNVRLSRLQMNSGIVSSGAYGSTDTVLPPVRHDDETIYDETGSSLSVCWKTADGDSMSVKYDRRGEKVLCELLKSLLSDSAEEESQ